MTTPISPIFQEAMDYNQDAAEGIYIEPSIMIIGNDGYCPGVQIEAHGFNYPVFLSVEQLREMADNAEKIANEMVNAQHETKPKKKKKN